jgi:uncharacterized protein (DUF427 family)
VSVRLRDVLTGAIGELRREPTPRRVRGVLAGTTVLDSTRVQLVWEPRRVLPAYAVPEADLAVPVTADPGDAVAHPGEVRLSDVGDRPVLDPRVPFAVHTAAGEPVLLQAARPVQALRLADPDLAGYVLVDFSGLDAWYEEDEQRFAHPRDPYHRIDVLPSSRTVRIERDGTVLAETTRAHLLYETMLPVRYYLPREDVRVPLRDSPTETWCAYKGRASYLSFDGGEDLIWTYHQPFPEVEPVRDLLCFFDERLDLVLDGVRVERPITPWS